MEMNHHSNSIQNFKVKSYEVKNSRGGLKVPVVNEVHLHSMYDPVKEAKTFMSKYETSFESKNKVLVFGLGYAYHIYELCKILERNHGGNYQVVVIEPNEQVYRDCIKYNLFPNKNIKVFSGFDLERVYAERDLIDFLISKPAIISHPASFELYRTYFEKFMKYAAPTGIADITKYIESKELRSYLYSDSNARSIDHYLRDNVLTKEKLNSSHDHLLLAYSHLSNGEF
ncbi:MAG: hypothetical protein CME69_00670 [Halobacteriovorax sp.]|nr:hypothetical protein [Halobacteriovorax sp.]|tara:strand:+ start:114 stop:797 length:684 start_codon:yes stop_codon:yes gene_type:complete